MALIIGSLALLLGMTAIWLATNAMKATAVQGDRVLQRIRTEQQEALTEVGVKLKALETSNRKLTEMMKKSSGEED